MDNKKNGQAVPGTDSPKVESPDLPQIKKWLAEDLKRAIMLLNAIASDPNLQVLMAEWFEGRIQNAKHKPDPAQVPMFSDSKVQS